MDGSGRLALVVTADDFGIGLETSRGIIEAHLRGPVTATSLMVVTGDHVRASVPLLEDTSDLDVGLHVVMTQCGHKPLVATRASGLVDREGDFHTNGGLWLRAFSRRLSRQGVEEEIAAQAAMFKTLMGREPAYVDSHHHAHQLPVIREAMIELAGRRVLPKVMRTTVDYQQTRKIGSARTRRRAANFIGRRAAVNFSAAGIWANDYFFGMLDPGDFDRSFPWEPFLQVLPESGTVEWIVHPGYRDETLRGRDDYRAERMVELNRLTEAVNRPSWEKFRDRLARKSVLAQDASAPSDDAGR
jgi:predicted glycoside hydrolase/deacetylase ChbG (UPF0249 family)